MVPHVLRLVFGEMAKFAKVESDGSSRDYCVSDLVETSPARVHCVVTSLSPMKGSKARVARRLALASLMALQRWEIEREVYFTRGAGRSSETLVAKAWPRATACARARKSVDCIPEA